MVEKVEKNENQRYWTQAEVAEHFRVTESTIKNWREQGHLAYFQLPGSTRVLYRVEDIRELEAEFTHLGKEVPKPEKQPETKREKPGASSRPKQQWRV